jgi:hypothetical protein
LPPGLAKAEAILDAAMNLLVERGLAATIMEMVAERFVSTMAIYANRESRAGKPIFRCRKLEGHNFLPLASFGGAPHGLD